MSLYTVYEKQHYDYRGRDIFTIECSHEEILKIVEELNYKNDRFNGKPLGCLGSSNYFDFRYTGRYFESVEEYKNFLCEQKIKEMENLADKRSFCVDNWG